MGGGVARFTECQEGYYDILVLVIIVNFKWRTITIPACYIVDWVMWLRRLSSRFITLIGIFLALKIRLCFKNL